MFVFLYKDLSKADGGTYDGESNECEEKAQEIVESIVQEMVNIVVGGIILISVWLIATVVWFLTLRIVLPLSNI